jgi:uncharacterized membrane protein YphA (DoxX/SURF4 family)
VVRPFSPPWGFAGATNRLRFPGPADRAAPGGALQRFFSTFPVGLPALGLLLLRAALGAALAVEGPSTLADRGFSSIVAAVLAPAALLSGGALVVGVFTPAAAAVAALVAASRVFTGGGPAAVFLVVVAVAVMLLGPGGLSVDARLFGRREIVVPRSSRPFPD